MERQVFEFFDGETMPDGLAAKIERRLTVRRSRTCALRRYAVAAAAMVVLMLAVFNADAICAAADSILDEIAHALKPEVVLELNRDIGRISDEEYHGYSNLEITVGDHSSSASYGGSDFATVEDGRLYFTGNGEYIDITDLCSEDEAYIYILDSGNGILHYLCVGGTPDNYGLCEFIFDMNAEQPWIGGCGFNKKDPNNNWEPYGWFVDVKETIGHPWGIYPIDETE